MKLSKPNRVKREYAQTLCAAPEVVFPLLCPVEEEKWVPGWAPEYVVSSSGVVELDCIFQTAGSPHSSVWIVSRYEPEKLHLEMYKVTPGHTVGKLQIQLSATGPDATQADISYEYTSLGSSGDTLLLAKLAQGTGQVLLPIAMRI